MTLYERMTTEKWVNLTDLTKQMAYEVSVAYKISADPAYIQGLLDAMGMIEATPTVSTLRRIWAAKGEWIEVDEESVECSICSAVCHRRHNYCPACGARMTDE